MFTEFYFPFVATLSVPLVSKAFFKVAEFVCTLSLDLLLIQKTDMIIINFKVKL